MTALLTTGEHPFHVLQRLSEWQAEGQPCALVIITATEGGAVRAPGALLAVSDTTSFGYISGGCIDADVVLQTRDAMRVGAARSLRYGAGSPFVDLPLPCGGAIEVTICPAPDKALIQDLTDTLANRQRVSVYLSSDGQLTHVRDRSEALRFDYQPPIRLRIAGRGADALALATISQAAGYETRLQLLDEDDIQQAAALGLRDIQKLTTVNALPDIADDPWTAFVLLFHDRDLETPLLAQAVSGPAFYIGAVGSRRTHANRCEALREAGLTEPQIARIHGPIGLVPSLREASSIALSTLAEIIDAAKQIPARDDARTAFVLLAAGASSRFETGDKLLADLDGQPVLHHTARLLNSHAPGQAIAVVSPGDEARTDILEQSGWTVIINDKASEGQARSIAAALRALEPNDDIDQIVILLGDMPRVPSAHIAELLRQACHPSVRAIMTTCDETRSPPALFKRDLFQALSGLTGDRGAKSVFNSMKDGAMTLQLSTGAGLDIDCIADLERARETEHA
ncbi:MAG: NTP transferase domain-containing protein [Pseudomonadota bacterium]